MAETGGKKGKKKKGKTVNLLEFLTDNQTSAVSLGPVLKSTSSWADESEDLATDVDNRWQDDSYGSSSAKRQMNLAALPTAPRASLETQIDYSKIPDQPPYTAFLGNLPYDVEKEDILDFFSDIKITEVRLPQDSGGGRAKGFGYAEFADKESLVQALSMNNETLRARKIRIDIAGQNQGGDRDRSDKDDGPDMTMSDWRAQPDEPSSRSGSRYGSSNGYQDRYSRDRRDDGWGRDSDRGHYHDYDDRRYPDSLDERRPRNHYNSNRYGDQYDNYRPGRSYQRDSWGSRYNERDRRDGHGGGDMNDPYAGAEFTRDQARPPVAKAPSSHNGDNQNDREDRGYGDQDDGGSRGYGDRDRGYGDRGYGDRDRGYGDRDRGYGDRDRGYGDRDRGYGDRDRGYGDRSRGYGDRSRGYGDRDRGYGDRDRGYGDRDRRYGDRDRGYGDRDRDFGDRDGYRRDYGSRGDEDDHDSAKERPRLQLKPRTKPVEEVKPVPAESRSSIFGGAKPVDTTAKEKEIEEKLEKLKVEVDLKKEKERDGTYARGEYRSRRDSGRSSEGESRSRKDSSRSNEDEGPASSRGRLDSEKSLEKEKPPTSKESPQDAPLPPPVNVWKQRMDAQKAGTTSDQPKEESNAQSNAEKPVIEKTAEKKNISSNAPTSPVGRGSNPKQHSRGSERGAARGRGKGRGEHYSRTHEAGDGRNKEEKKERKEKRAPELKKIEDQPPVFHQTSKFSLLMDEDDDEDQNESAET